MTTQAYAEDVVIVGNEVSGWRSFENLKRYKTTTELLLHFDKLDPVTPRVVSEGSSAESARGIAPRAAHRSGLEPLDSSGLCHPLKAAAFRRDQRAPPVAR
jgi:hypothetical protein